MTFHDAGDWVRRRDRLPRARVLDGTAHACSSGSAVPAHSEYLDGIGRIRSIDEQAYRATAVYARKRGIAFDFLELSGIRELPIGGADLGILLLNWVLPVGAQGLETQRPKKNCEWRKRSAPNQIPPPAGQQSWNR